MSARPVLLAAWSVVWRLLAFLSLLGLLLAAWFIPLQPAMRGLRSRAPHATDLAAEIGMALTLLLASAIFARLDRKRLRDLGLAPGGAARDVAIGLAMGAAGLGAALAILAIAGRIGPGPGRPRADEALALALGAVAVNALTQQLLLNGYPYRVLRDRTGPVAAVVISAAIFSAYHAGAFRGAWLPPVNVFLAGLVFVLARERTGRIWLPLGMHIAWNGLLGPVLSLTVSGQTRLGTGAPALRLEGSALWTGGAFGLEGGLAVTIAALALIALLSIGFRPRPSAAAGPPPGA